MPVLTRYLIVNADDFGLSLGVNRGILEAYRDGILTSASLMVNGDAFEDAAGLIKQHRGLSLGLHLTLVEAAPVLPPHKVGSLVTSEGRFPTSLSAFLLKWFTGRLRLTEILEELEAQVEKAISYGIRVEKLDSHMHLHLVPGLTETFLAVAKKFGIKRIRLPLSEGRNASFRGLLKRMPLTYLGRLHAPKIAAEGILYPDRFCGLAESGALTHRALARILQNLGPGVTELMVHPGYQDVSLDRWPRSRLYRREEELKALTSFEIKHLVSELGIKLVGFAEADAHTLSGLP